MRNNYTIHATPQFRALSDDQIEKFEAYFAGLEKKFGDVKFIGGDLIPPADVDQLAGKIRDADAVLLIHLSGHGGDAPVLELICRARVPVVIALLCLAAGAGAGEYRALRLEAIERGGIGVVALRLDQHVVVPVQSIGFQLAQDGVGCAGLATRAVEIFHAHQPAPANRTGIEKAGHRGDQRAEMQRAGG